MFLIAYLPEVIAFIQFILVSVQALPIGSLLVLIQMGLFGLLVLVRPKESLQTLLRWWPLLLTPILAVASFAWSDLPAVSARYGAQFLFTALFGVFLARLLTPRRFVIVLMVSTFVFCIMCILFGRQGSSADGMVLIGLTGSKNQMAYEAQLLLTAALVVLMLGRISITLRWIAVLALPLSIYLLSATNSATAVLMAFGGSAVLIGMRFSEGLSAGGRLAALVGGVIVLAPLTLLIPEAIQFMNHFLFDTLNKDPTLTGRIFLWERADDLIARRPLLGYGYQSVWMGDTFDSIGLRRLAGIEDGRVFHFHHQFRQIAVDTGLLGLICFIGILLAMGFSALRQLLLRPSLPTSFFFVMFLLMVVRAFTDAIIGPFSIHTILFYAAGVYAFWSPARDAEKPAQPASAPWLQRGAAAVSRYARR